MSEVQVIQMEIKPKDLRKLSSRLRNQVVGCMHAHNELGVLNRLLRFSTNTVGTGDLHDDAHNVQMWTVLQILTGKLFETWNMIGERFLTCNPEDPAVSSLSPTERNDLEELREYFGDSGKRTNALKILRDKTAFHYDKLNLDKATDSITPEESRIFIAQHPANTCYYAGSALVFRSAFSMIADKLLDVSGLSTNEKMAQGFELAIKDIDRANYHMHNVLYGFISRLLEETVGGPLENEDQTRISVTGVPNPNSVLIPMFLDASQPNPTPS